MLLVICTVLIVWELISWYDQCQRGMQRRKDDELVDKVARRFESGRW